MSVDPYLRQVDTALQARGVTPQRRADLLAEMESHLLDSGEDPPEAFGPAEVFAQRLAGQLPTGDDEPGGQGWDRPRARSLVREQMQTNQQLAERGWNPGWKGRPFYRQQARWQSPQAPGSVLDTVTAFTAQHHGRLRTRDSDGLTATLGSRIAFRIFGVFMKTADPACRSDSRWWSTPTPVAPTWKSPSPKTWAGASSASHSLPALTSGPSPSCSTPCETPPPTT